MDITFQKKLLDFVEDDINPSLSSHGGWIEIISSDEKTGVVEILMGGGCHGCGASAATIKYGITAALMEQFPVIKEVIDVTDHTTGNNPFFMGDPFK